MCTTIHSTHFIQHTGPFLDLSGPGFYSQIKAFIVQSLSHVQLFRTPWAIACQAPLSFTISWSLIRFMSIELVMLWRHLLLSLPLLLLPSIFSSRRVFSNESVLCISWPKYWSFNISPSNKYSGFISFRIDWFDLLAVQGVLKSPLQHTV